MSIKVFGYSKLINYIHWNNVEFLKCLPSKKFIKKQDFEIPKRYFFSYQRPAPVNVHMPCDTVAMNFGKDKRRGLDPRTPHRLCFQDCHPEIRNSEQHSSEKREERGWRKWTNNNNDIQNGIFKGKLEKVFKLWIQIKWGNWNKLK